jgi:hypothetical protein
MVPADAVAGAAVAAAASSGTAAATVTPMTAGRISV